MAGVITTANHPKALWPGVRAWFGREYSQHPMECSQIFEMKNSKMAYEEDVRIYGFGNIPQKAEGASTTYMTESQAEVTRYTHAARSAGYIVTLEERDDNLYEKVSRTRAGALAFSFRNTKEIVCANVLNRAFNSSYTGGDGKELLATDHPTQAGGFSNELAIPADLSEAALEDLAIQIAETVDYTGKKIAIKIKQLIIPPSQNFEAARILKSTLRSGTADNDINALYSMGTVPKTTVNHYLTDDDAWFLQTNVPNGLIFFNRKSMSFTRDNDFDTDNAKAKGYERYSVGWTDWLGLFGSEGAS